MRLLWAVAGLLMALLASGLGLAHSKYHSRSLFNELTALQAQESELHQERRQLQLELSHLAALTEVDSKARRQLKMFIPHPHDIVYLTP